MDFNSAFLFVSQTFADEMHGSATFDANDGGQIRVELSIEGRQFRLFVRDDKGHSLIITPGAVLAQKNQQLFSEIGVSTHTALDAWKSQPPLTYSPIQSGLTQLQITNNTIADIISQFANTDVTLSIAILTKVCWHQGLYHNISLPGIDIADFEGRVCLSDMTISLEHLSFRLDFRAICKKLRIELGQKQELMLANTECIGHLGVHVDIANKIADGELFRLWVDAKDASNATIWTAVHAAPITLQFPDGMVATVVDFKITLTWAPLNQILICVDNGPVRWCSTKATLSPIKLKLGNESSLINLQQATLEDFEANITFRSNVAGQSFMLGTLRVGTVVLKADITLPSLLLTDFEGTLQLPNLMFSSAGLSTDAYLDGKFHVLAMNQIEIEDSAVSTNCHGLVFKLDGNGLVAGEANISIRPVTTDRIMVKLPDLVTGTVDLVEFKSGYFSGADLNWRKYAGASRPASSIAMREGFVEWGKLRVLIDGNDKQELIPKQGGSFHVWIPRFIYSSNSSGPPRIGISTSVENTTELAQATISFGGKPITFTIEKIKGSVWTVGDFDARAGLALKVKDVKFDTSPITVVDALLRVLADEYLYGDTGHRSVKRQLIAELALRVAGIPKEKSSDWDTGELPINEDALLEYLRDRNSNDAAEVLINILQAANTFPAMIEVQLYIQFKGSMNIKLDAANSSQSQLVFVGELIVKEIRPIAKVIGRIGICPLCYERVIKEFAKTINVSYKEAIKVFLPVDYNPVTNTITTNPRVEPAAGLLSVFAAWLANFLIGQFNYSFIITLPGDIRLKSLTLNFSEAGNEVGVMVSAGAEKIDWS